MLAIIDYQAGNQTSVRRACDHLGIPALISAEPETLARADGLIFPGVGAAGQAMGRLKASGLDLLIKELAAQGRPMLGVCLGCQILLEESEEDGGVKTLGLLPGRSRRFDSGWNDGQGRAIRIPHMGWNTARPVGDNPLWRGIDPAAQFYFVHSYYPEPAAGLALAESEHGRPFVSAFGREGLWAVQFHPEKSGAPGLRLLKNFADYCAE